MWSSSSVRADRVAPVQDTREENQPRRRARARYDRPRSAGILPRVRGVHNAEEVVMFLYADRKPLHARAEPKRSPEIVATTHRAVEKLRASWAPGRVRKVGEVAPPFALPNADERIVDSASLLAR